MNVFWGQHCSHFFQRFMQPVLYPAPAPMAHTRAFWRATALVILVTLLFAGFFILYLTRLQDAYLTHAEDLGIMDQAIWNTLHGQFLHQTLCNSMSDTNCYRLDGISRFAIHFEPVLLPVSLLYLLFPSPKTLLVIQTLIVASGAFPAFWLARLRLRNEGAGAACAVLYLLYPAQQQATVFDFHAVTFTASFLLFTLYFLYTRRTAWLFVFALLSMACKEEIPGIIALLGLWSCVFQHRWRSGLALTILAFAWVAISLVMIHLFSPSGHSLLTSRYAYLGNSPGQIVRTLLLHPVELVKQHLLEQNHLFYLRTLLTPTGYLVLLAPWILFLALPSLALNLLSTDPQMYSGLFQYNAEIVPILIFAVIEALVLLQSLSSIIEARSKRLADLIKVSQGKPDLRGARRLRSHVRLTKRTGLLLLLTGYILFNTARADAIHATMPFSQGFVWPQPSTHTSLAQSILKDLPPTASVSAQSSLVPHISHRATIYLFPYADTVANYVLLDVTSDIYPFVHSLDYIREVKKLLFSGSYRVIAARDGYLLLKHELPAPGISSHMPLQPTNATDIGLLAPNLPAPFCSYIMTSSPTHVGPALQVTFSQPGTSSAALNLIDFTLKVPARLSISTSYLSVTTSWQVRSPIKTPLQLVILLIDKNGHEHFVSRDIPPLFWCQTTTWRPGTIVSLTSRVFSLRGLALPGGPAHIALALEPLLQPTSAIMDVQARLPVQVLHAPRTVTTTKGTNALQLLPLTLVP